MKILNENFFHNTTFVLGTFYSIGNWQRAIGKRRFVNFHV